MANEFRTVKVLPRQSLAIDTHYVEITNGAPLISAFIRWFDGTGDAAITVESTDLAKDEAASDSTEATEWAAESGVSITGPAGSAAGCVAVHLGNLATKRVRLKIVASAACDMEILSTAKG
jgi:hypothetical protein